jgi:hypothetical protein
LLRINCLLGFWVGLNLQKKGARKRRERLFRAPLPSERRIRVFQQVFWLSDHLNA